MTLLPCTPVLPIWTVNGSQLRHSYPYDQNCTAWVWCQCSEPDSSHSFSRHSQSSSHSRSSRSQSASSHSLSQSSHSLSQSSHSLSQSSRSLSQSSQSRHSSTHYHSIVTPGRFRNTTGAPDGWLLRLIQDNWYSRIISSTILAESFELPEPLHLQTTPLKFTGPRHFHQCSRKPVDCGTTLDQCKDTITGKLAWRMLCGHPGGGIWQPPPTVGRFLGEVRFVCTCANINQYCSSKALSYRPGSTHLDCLGLTRIGVPQFVGGRAFPARFELAGNCRSQPYNQANDYAAYTWCRCPCTTSRQLPKVDPTKCPVSFTRPHDTGDGHWVLVFGCEQFGNPGTAGEFYGDTQLVGWCTCRSSRHTTGSRHGSHSFNFGNCDSLPQYRGKIAYDGDVTGGAAITVANDDACLDKLASAWLWCQCPPELIPCPDPGRFNPCPQTGTARRNGTGGWINIGGYGADNKGPPPVEGRYYGEIVLLAVCSEPTITPATPKYSYGQQARRRPYIRHERVQLIHGCAPGDIVCMTALPRDIMLADPERYEIHVATHYPELWANNPYVASYQLKPIADARPIELNYGSPMIYIDHVRKHFLTAFHRNFEDLEQMTVPCRFPRPDLYFSLQEQAVNPIGGDYWVIFPGGKSDFTAKIWSAARWQELVNRLRDRGIKVVQCGRQGTDHHNPRLDGVVDMVGKTRLREVLQIILHSSGVVSHVSFPMHVAAAVEKPCVVIAGGREHLWWEAYMNFSDMKPFGAHAPPIRVPHRFLHTIDKLPCCMGRGCWKSKVLQGKSSACPRTRDDGFGQSVPECLHMISVDQVVDAVMSYSDDAAQYGYK